MTSLIKQQVLPGAGKMDRLSSSNFKTTRPWRLVAALLLVLVMSLTLLRDFFLTKPYSRKCMHQATVPECPTQPPPLAPNVIWKPEESSEWIQQSAQTMSKAVQIPTISYDDMAMDPAQDGRFRILNDFHQFLNHTFPLFHSKAKLTKINTYGLLYEWTGNNPLLSPALYAAHQDVVPVPKDTESRWTHPPFKGVYDRKTDLLWGRGASDDKSMLISIFEALEQLQRENFENQRTVFFALGFDEEIGGRRGAAAIGEELRSRFGSHDPFEFILDEGGMGVGTTQNGKLDVAMPAVGEKGYADIRITVTTEGGHSSVPPDHTAIGILSKILVELEANPFQPTLTDENPFLTHLICLADALDGRESSGLTEVEPVPKSDQKSGFVMDRQLRKLLRNPKHWNKAAARIASEGTRSERYVIQTSQAVDVIQGGAKANALPESASAVINHRIAFGSDIDEIKRRMLKLVQRIAKKYQLEISGFDNKGSDQQRAETEAAAMGRIHLQLLEASQPTRLSRATSPQFRRLAATIKHVFPGKGGRDRLVTPAIMTGNTDTRHYLDLSANVWRFHPNTYAMDSGKHAIDERMKMYAHAQTTRFIHAFVRNTDNEVGSREGSPFINQAKRKRMREVRSGQ